jgi:hypothetical protein
MNDERIRFWEGFFLGAVIAAVLILIATGVIRV